MQLTYEWPAPPGHTWNEIALLNMIGKRTRLIIDKTYQATIVDIHPEVENKPDLPPGIEVLGDFGYKTVLVTLEVEEFGDRD